MAGLIVKAFPLLQEFQKGDAACHKKGISPDDHADHRHEEGLQGFQRLFGDHRQIIADSHHDHTKNSEKPPGPGLFLPLVSTPEKLHRPGFTDLQQVVGKGHGENRKKQRQGLDHGRRRHRKGHPHVIVQDLQKQQIHQFPKYDSQHQA